MTRFAVRLISIVTFLSVLSPVVTAWGGPPTDQLRDGVDRVVVILHDPVLAGDRQISQRRAAIGQVAGEIFDFGDMARRSLGPHWEKRSPAERAEFARLFTELVQRSYIAKVDQHGSAASVTFLGDTIDEDYAVVKTTIPLGNGGTMPLDYRMHSAGGHWRVYDLSMDGISLLANYRAQFNKIIRTGSFEELVAKLKANQAEFSAPSASPASASAASASPASGKARK
jgi:phospholipid transport system substrate-binding protein